MLKLVFYFPTKYLRNNTGKGIRIMFCTNRYIGKRFPGICAQKYICLSALKLRKAIKPIATRV